MTMDCRAGVGVAAFPSVSGLIRNHGGLGASRFWRDAYLLDHDGNGDRARDCGSSHFVRSQVEKRDLVHAGLGSDIALGRKDKEETGKRETVTNLINSPLLLAGKVSLLVNSVFL